MVIAPEQYGSRTAKAEDTQALNTSIFYDLIILKKDPATSEFADIISNYDLVVHNIESLYLQISNITNEPIKCTFNILQYMEHSVRTAFEDSDSIYRGDKRTIPPQNPSTRIRENKWSVLD